MGINEIGQYIQAWQTIEHSPLSDAPDQLVWKWTTSGTYTARSCYLATFQGSTTCFAWNLI